MAGRHKINKISGRACAEILSGLTIALLPYIHAISVCWKTATCSVPLLAGQAHPFLAAG